MSAHTGELLSGTSPFLLNFDSKGCLAEVGAASSSTTRGQLLERGVLGHFDVDFSGRLFEVVGTTAV